MRLDRLAHAARGFAVRSATRRRRTAAPRAWLLEVLEGRELLSGPGTLVGPGGPPGLIAGVDANPIPAFTNLSAPTVTYGSATPTTLSGHIAAGAQIPTGLPVTVTLNGVVKSANVDASGDFTTVFDTSHLPVSGSPYLVSYDFAAAGGFAAAHSTTNLTVNKAHLTVTALSTGKIQGTANPVLTASITGFVNGETQAVVSGAPGLSTTAITSSPVGVYPITVTAGTLSAANYDFPNLVNGTLTVFLADTVTVTLGAGTTALKVGNPATFAVTVTPGQGGGGTPSGTVKFRVNGQDLGSPVALSGGSATSASWTPTVTGSVTVTAVYTGDSTYQPNSGGAQFTVTTTLSTPSVTLTTPSYAGPNGDLVTLGRRAGGYRWFDLSGTGQPNVFVDLINVNNGNTTTTVSTDAAGKYTIALAGFYNGTYGFQVQQRNNAGDVSERSPVLKLTIATTEGDYGGTNKATQALYTRSSADLSWSVIGLALPAPVAFGASATAVPLAGDLDADGKTDLLYYMPSTAQWYTMRSAFKYTPTLLGSWGWPGIDIPAPADYNGDGMTDIAVYRPAAQTGSDGTWYVAIAGRVTGITIAPIITPLPGDVPVPADYDFVGHAEAAIFRPSTGQWVIKDQRSAAAAHTITFGAGAANVPVPGVYLSTSRAAVPSVFNTSNGQWLIWTGPGTQRTLQFAAGDIPAPADYNGDGVTEPVVFRPGDGKWYTYLPGGTTPVLIPASYGASSFGGSAYVPVNAPYRYRQIVGTNGTVTALGVSGSAEGITAAPVPSAATAVASAGRTTTTPTGRRPVADVIRTLTASPARGKVLTAVGQSLTGKTPGQA